MSVLQDAAFVARRSFEAQHFKYLRYGWFLFVILLLALPLEAWAQQAPPFVFVLNVSNGATSRIISPCDESSFSGTNGADFLATKTSTGNTATASVTRYGPAPGSFRPDGFYEESGGALFVYALASFAARGNPAVQITGTQTGNTEVMTTQGAHGIAFVFNDEAPQLAYLDVVGNGANTSTAPISFKVLFGGLGPPLSCYGQTYYMAAAVGLGTHLQIYNCPGVPSPTCGRAQATITVSIAVSIENTVITSGNQQTGNIQAQLPNLLVVTVMNSEGAPAPGAPAPGITVSFAVTGPSGATGYSLTNTTATTGADGSASTQLTLGDKPGQYQVTASCPPDTCSNSVIFTETARVPVPDIPNLGPCSTPQNPSGCSQEPVNTATGNYYSTHIDLRVPARGFPFVFQRSYNSLDTYAGPLGTGWTHSYNVSLNEDALTGIVRLKEGGSGLVAFAPIGGGNYTPATGGVFDTLTKNPDGSFRLTQMNQTQLNFSNLGRLWFIKDRNGNALNFSFDGQGNLTTIIDASSRRYSLTYGANGRLISLTDPLGRAMQYAYDARDRLVSFRDPAGSVTTYDYDSNDRLISATDARGNAYVQNTYDPQGRVIAQKNARNFTTTFTYDTPTTGTTIITDPLGNVTQHVHDSALRLIQEIDAVGGITSYTYDSNNLRLAITDPLGHVQSFGYDANGNTISITDATGETSTFTYESKNNLLSSTDRLGTTTIFTYDANGNLLTTTDPAGSTTSFTYDSYGEVLSATNALNFTTSFQYDGTGNLIKTTDPLGGSLAMSYDGVGRSTSIQNQLGKTAKRIYDPANRLLTVTDPLGNTTQFAYDANGNPVSITDPNGKQTQFAYDATNKLAQVTDTGGGVTHYQYNGNTDVTAMTDANGHTRSYSYDALRRLSVVTDPLGRQKRYSYDAVGNVTSTIDGNNETNTFGFDALNRLVSLALADGKNVTYAYDANGNRLSMVDWRGTTSYSYDLLNRVTSITTPDGKMIAYAYDAVGNRVSLTYPDGKVVNNVYDGLNRLTGVAAWSGNTTVYSYDPSSNLKGVARPNGTLSSYQYDAANRLTNITNRSGNTVLSGFTYALDNAGNRLQMRTNLGGVNQYSYDALYRLTSWTAASGQITNYAYDSVGNRTSITSPTGTTKYNYDAADELLSAGTTTYTYDANGNQLSKTVGSTTLNYRWDSLDRLVSVVGGNISTSYQYDGDGNRTSQQEPAGSYSYVNDVAAALPVVLAETGPDGNLSYVYGASLISAASSTFQYYHQYDGLGSTTNLTDSSGAQMASYSYDPWGSLTVLDPVGSTDKYKFTAEALDQRTGLYYLRARYYDPSIGRFLSRDPLRGSPTLPLSSNMYAYAQDNPLGFRDPSGLEADAANNAQPNNQLTCEDNPVDQAGGNLHGNIQISNALLTLAVLGGPAGAFEAVGVYYLLVKTGGPWDFKNSPGPGTHDLRVAAGNVNFGATCFLGSEFCQYGAGIYGKLTGNPGTAATHFDNPLDNQQIQQGQALRKKGC